MSCQTCGSTFVPCCCQPAPCSPCEECSETLEYTGININLAGTGVLDGLVNFEFQFRGVRGVAPIQSVYNATTKCIEIGFDGSAFLQQATVADNAARASLTPQFLGQLLTQRDTGKIYIGTSISVGGWTLFTP